MNKAWWKESVVYQIYPRSFKDSNGDGIGDLQGIIEKLDYLKELGVGVIWLSPVYQSPNDDNGYDISDYQKIMADFGTMADWEQLIKEMHERGLKLMMDLVVNHTSDEHHWFIESRKSRDNPYRHYYIWRDGKDGQEPTNWEAAFSGSAWKYNEPTDDYYLHLFSEKQPDLNWENPTLREEIYTMMKWWLDKGIDGFRMDVINFISKDQRFPDGDAENGKKYVSGHQYYMNGPKVHEYLQEMNERVLSLYPIMTVGEMPGVTPEEGILYTGEDRNELDMVFHFEHMDIDAGEGGKWNVKRWSLVELKEILSKWQTGLDGKGWNSLYWNNHDQPRVVSRFGDDTMYRERSGKMLAAVLHMMQGTPFIYQGEELGMTNIAFSNIEEYKDIETLNMFKEKLVEGVPAEDLMKAIHIKSRDNARTPMQWDNSLHGGFTEGTPWLKVNPNYKEVNAASARKDTNSIYHFYKKLIRLRKEYDIIVYGSYELLEKDSEELFVYTRRWKGATLLVIANFTDNYTRFEPPNTLIDTQIQELLITNYEWQLTVGSSMKDIELRPYEVQVFMLQ